MIFVNSCNLSKSSLNACEEKGKKKRMKQKHKKKNRNAKQSLTENINKRLTMVWNIKSNE